MEIERKFVLPRRPAELDGAPAERIEQGYLAIDGDVEVRVRERGGATVLTVKGGHGRERTETELDVSRADFDALWPLTEGRRVSKVRSTVALPGGLTAEVDVYEGAHAGLVVAEVEFPSREAADAFTPPAWLGDEVTGDARYANQALAAGGATPVRP